VSGTARPKLFVNNNPAIGRILGLKAPRQLQPHPRGGIVCGASRLGGFPSMAGRALRCMTSSDLQG
jgi:hypothetical protein